MIKGLYIHIPFCSLKCPYCDFTSITLLDEKIHKQYIEALKKELLIYSKSFDINLETVYFGGGTPSILKPSFLGELLSFIKENVKTEKELEITVEVNPDTYRFDEFKQIKEYGINRISIGAQSFLEKNLKALGRNHTPEDTYECVESAYKAGIENINIDMIYGISGQSLLDLEKDLNIYTSLPVKHISAYMLTAYENTQLGNQVKEGLYTMPEEEVIEEMFYLINRTLEKKGFNRYELSNWSKEGFKCRHNLFYWTHVEFLGIGVSSWSFVNKKRFGNTTNINSYMEKIKRDEIPVLFEEQLSDEDIKKEKVILGLRLSEGVDYNLIKDRKREIDYLKKAGLICVKNGKVKLSEKGVLVSNQIINMLV